MPMKYAQAIQLLNNLLLSASSNIAHDLIVNNTELLDEIIEELRILQGPHITSRGFKPSHRNNFVLYTGKAPDPKEIPLIQAKLGFHPGGYGCYEIRTTVTPFGNNRTTWNCSSSCD